MTVKSYRFSKSQRLTHSSQYKPVFERGRRHSSQCFVMFVCHSDKQKDSRLGLVVSRKNARHAVQRNRIKRLIRESFRRQSLVHDGFDIIVSSKSSATEKSNAELVQQLDTLWHKIKQ